MKRKRLPARVALIGLLFIAAGCLACLEMFANLMRSRLILNFGVLMLPVGFGLLRGRSSSRRWAKCWVGLMAFASAMILVIYPAAGDAAVVKWNGWEPEGMARHAVAMGSGVVGLLVAWALWRGLSSRSVADFFDDHKPDEAERGDASQPPPADPGR